MLASDRCTTSRRTAIRIDPCSESVSWSGSGAIEGAAASRHFELSLTCALPPVPVGPSAHNPSLDADRAKVFTGINIINEAYVAPQSAFSHPPPPRKAPSEFDRLMAPETFRHEPQMDQPSERHSTKHHPHSWDPKQTTPSQQALTAREIATQPLVGVDPHQQAYNDSFGAGSPKKHRGIRTGYYDPTRAGVSDAQRSERRQGIRQVDSRLYTSSVLGAGIGTVGPPTAMDYSATGTGVAGVIQPTRSEALDTHARGAGQGASSRSSEADSAGVKTYGVVDRRPGSKLIRPENVYLRRSDQVADALRDSSAADRQSDALRFQSIKLNRSQRQRDFGQNQSYDIISLNGAGGETGRGYVAPDARSSLDGAGRSSRDLNSRPWTGVGGSGYADARRNGPVATSAGQGLPPNQVSHLDNTFKVANPADSGGPIYRGDGTGRNVGTGGAARNQSTEMWTLMAGQ